MEIPNLKPEPVIVPKAIPTGQPLSIVIMIIILSLSLSLGFWGSRLFPITSAKKVDTTKALVIDAESITDSTSIVTGKVYGNVSKAFKDSATGTIEKGSINGEGTHILVREGGLSQRASLTSSVVDLDLFVGKKVEIKGETNASTKTSWLLDVGTIKIID